MELSLTEAARLLGKSERQMRYLIQEARVPARKLHGHWAVRQLQGFRELADAVTGVMRLWTSTAQLLDDATDTARHVQEGGVPVRPLGYRPGVRGQCLETREGSAGSFRNAAQDRVR